jgi:hypothetical protein
LRLQSHFFGMLAAASWRERCEDLKLDFRLCIARHIRQKGKEQAELAEPVCWVVTNALTKQFVGKGTEFGRSRSKSVSRREKATRLPFCVTPTTDGSIPRWDTQVVTYQGGMMQQAHIIFLSMPLWGPLIYNSNVVYCAILLVVNEVVD